MRSVSKSTGRLAWVLCLFGFDRLAAMLGKGPAWPGRPSPEMERTAESCSVLTRMVRQHLSPGFEALFRAGDEILHRVIDAFSFSDRPVADPGSLETWHAEAAYGLEPREHGAPTDRSWMRQHPEMSEDPATQRTGAPWPGAASVGPRHPNDEAHQASRPQGPEVWQPMPRIPDIGDFVGVGEESDHGPLDTPSEGGEGAEPR